MKEKTKTNLTKESPEKVKVKAKEIAEKEHEITKEETKILEECLKQAKMPVALTDADFKLGDYELDIRKLCRANKDQMMFRTLALEVVYLRNISQSLVDTMRLLMLVLKNQGTEDIVKATEDLLTELQNKVNKA